MARKARRYAWGAHTQRRPLARLCVAFGSSVAVYSAPVNARKGSKTPSSSQSATACRRCNNAIADSWLWRLTNGVFAGALGVGRSAECRSKNTPPHKQGVTAKPPRTPAMAHQLRRRGDIAQARRGAGSSAARAALQAMEAALQTEDNRTKKQMHTSALLLPNRTQFSSALRLHAFHMPGQRAARTVPQPLDTQVVSLPFLFPSVLSLARALWPHPPPTPSRAHLKGSRLSAMRLDRPVTVARSHSQRTSGTPPQKKEKPEFWRKWTGAKGLVHGKMRAVLCVRNDDACLFPSDQCLCV